MAPLMYMFYCPKKKVLLISLVFCYSLLQRISVMAPLRLWFGGRIMLEEEEEQEPVLPKKKTPPTTVTKSPPLKNQTKLAKPTTTTVLSSSKNQTKMVKFIGSKNQTKPLKPTNSTKTTTYSIVELKKLNSTSKFKKLNSTSNKPSNSTKIASLTKKDLDLIKLAAPKNKTTKPVTASTKKVEQNDPRKEKTTPKPKQSSWVDQEDDDAPNSSRLFG